MPLFFSFGMTTINRPLFRYLLLVFLLHQICQKLIGLQVPLLDQYLDTFLMAPLLLTGLLAEWRDLYQLGRDYVFSTFEVILISLFLCFVSEVLFPFFSDGFTADFFDVMAILSGSLFFFFFLNQPGTQVSAIRSFL